MSPTRENGEEKAPHACSACKRGKRKCDKQLPRCSLCERLGRECDYSDESFNSPSDIVIATLQNRVNELETILSENTTTNASAHSQQGDTISQRSLSNVPTYKPLSHASQTNPQDEFPAIFFLDNSVFQDARLVVPRPSPPIPDDIRRIVGKTDNLRDIATQYFDEIHVWIPILCRKRFEILLSSATDVDPSSELALLFAAMRLLTDVTSNCMFSVRSEMYWTVKSYAGYLEANAVMTPQLLQAKVLIATYEVGHAIYPAAYLSVGSCAVLGKAFGLDNRKVAPQMLRKFGAWAEIEEIGRLWWAILVLDRYIHLGIPGHSLTTAEPKCDDILPADDTHFDKADVVGCELLFVASPTTIRAGPFTRTCQAAYLLGQVIYQVNNHLNGSQMCFTSALQIYQSLVSLLKTVQEEFERSPEQYATSLALAFSAFIHLCNPFCQIEVVRGDYTPEEAELRRLCIAIISTIADDTAKLALRLRPSMSIRHGALSPLLGNCFYVGVVTLARRVYDGEHSAVESYQLLRDGLSAVNGRWAVGGEYLRALDRSKELLYPSPLL